MPPLPCSNARLGGGDPDCRNVSPACGFGTPALPINFEGKDIVRAAFLAAAVHAGREDIFERDVSGLLRGEQLFPMTVSVHAHSLCRIRYLTKQGRDAHRGRCPYCSSHSARDHWSARPRIVRCRPRPPKTTQTRHRRDRLVKAAAVAGAKSRSLCRKPSYPAALVGLHGRSVPFAHRRGTVPAAPCLQCLALGRVRPPKRNVGDRTAVAICRVDFYFGLCARLGRRSLDSHLLAALLCVVGRGAGGPLHRSRQHHGYSPAGNGSPCPPSAGSSLHVANRQPASSVKSVAQRPQHADNR